MSDDEAQEAAKRALPPRSTRGKRVSQLVGEAAEADEDFWNQEAFQEAASDTEFSSTTPSSDTADTDIDEPESEEDEKSRQNAARGAGRTGAASEAAMRDDDEEGASKQKAYVDPAKRRAAARRAVPAGAAADPAGRKTSAAQAAALEEATEADLAITARRNQARDLALQRRKEVLQGPSSRKAAESTSTPRAAAAAAHPKLTQEAILEEAAETELQNLASLKVMAEMEEAKRKRHLAGDAGKSKDAGKRKRRIRWLATQQGAWNEGGSRTLTFLDRDEFPRVINSGLLPQPERITSAVSDATARFQDPEDRTPFASAAEWKQLHPDRAAIFQSKPSRPDRGAQRVVVDTSDPFASDAVQWA